MPPTEEEKATRRARVVAVKDALARSAQLNAPHVAPARAALREFLRNLNEPRQPSEAAFEELLRGPFRVIDRDRRPRR